MQKNFFEILVQTALTVGLFWTILKLTPKSALLSFTILYFGDNKTCPNYKRETNHLFCTIGPTVNKHDRSTLQMVAIKHLGLFII